MSKGGVGYTDVLPTNFRGIMFRDFLPKVKEANKLMDDEYETIFDILTRANQVMEEMERKDGMEFVNIQTLVIPKSPSCYTVVSGKTNPNVAVSGRYRIDQTSFIGCFQIVRLWFRRRGGIGGAFAYGSARSTIAVMANAALNSNPSNPSIPSEGAKPVEGGAKPAEGEEEDSWSIIKQRPDSPHNHQYEDLMQRVQQLEQLYATRLEQLSASLSSLSSSSSSSAAPSHPVSSSSSSSSHPQSSSLFSFLKPNTTNSSTDTHTQPAHTQHSEGVVIPGVGLVGGPPGVDAEAITDLQRSLSTLKDSLQNLEARAHTEHSSLSVSVDTLTLRMDEYEALGVTTQQRADAGDQALKGVQDDMKTFADKWATFETRFNRARDELEAKMRSVKGHEPAIDQMRAQVNQHHERLQLLDTKVGQLKETQGSSGGSVLPAAAVSLGGALRMWSKPARVKQAESGGIDHQSVSECALSSLRPLLDHAARQGADNIVVIFSTIPDAHPEHEGDIALPKWLFFDSFSLLYQKGKISLRPLRQEAKDKDSKRILKFMDAYIQAYQEKHRFVGCLSVPPLCLKGLFELDSLHLVANACLQDAVEMEVSVELASGRAEGGAVSLGVLLHESEEDFPTKWEQHKALLVRDKERPNFLIARFSWP